MERSRTGLVWRRRCLPGDLEDHAAGQVELGFEGGEDSVAEGFVFDERGVEAGDAEVGFGEGHFYVADDVEEEGEVAHHGAGEGRGRRGWIGEVWRAWPTPNQAGTSWRDCIQPKTQGMARRSAMDFLLAALGGAGAEAGVLEFGYGGGLFEVDEGVGVVDDVLFVEGEGGFGELVEGGLPGGGDFAGEVGSSRSCGG